MERGASWQSALFLTIGEQSAVHKSCTHSSSCSPATPVLPIISTQIMSFHYQPSVGIQILGFLVTNEQHLGAFATERFYVVVTRCITRGFGSKYPMFFVNFLRLLPENPVKCFFSISLAQSNEKIPISFKSWSINFWFVCFFFISVNNSFLGGGLKLLECSSPLLVPQHEGKCSLVLLPDFACWICCCRCWMWKSLGALP